MALGCGLKWNALECFYRHQTRRLLPVGTGTDVTCDTPITIRSVGLANFLFVCQGSVFESPAERDLFCSDDTAV